MITIDVDNVSEAFVKGLKLLRTRGILQSSRAGEVLVLDEPVTTVYRKPHQRVLFAEGRVGNPIFALAESIWMLAGQSNARWLDQFIADFSFRFAEEDGEQWGAYGFRWRSWFKTDQISIAILKLMENPLDRQVVIGMWDPEKDMLVSKKDRPCNLMIVPRIIGDKLDISVFCRSNDVVWGAYGANAVQFSVLQEYMATKLGLQVGVYRQISCNWHGYVSILNKLPENPETINPYSMNNSGEIVHSHRLIDSVQDFDGDCEIFVSKYWNKIRYKNSIFEEVLCPMMHVNNFRKNKKWDEALKHSEQISHSDWRKAVEIWLISLRDGSNLKETR